MKKYRVNYVHLIIVLTTIIIILSSLAIYEKDLILKAFLGLGIVINSLFGFSLFFEHFLVGPNQIISVKCFGFIRHEVPWDMIGRMSYNVNNKLVKAIRVDYGSYSEKSIIINNSHINYKELVAYVYDKAKDNRGFSVDYRVLDDINAYKELKK